MKDINFTEKEKIDLMSVYSSLSYDDLKEKIAMSHMLLLRARMMCLRLDSDGTCPNEKLAIDIEEFLEAF